MTVHIWVLEKELEHLKKLCRDYLISAEDPYPIRYLTVQPSTGSKEWICVNISLDNFTRLKDHDLLY